MEAPAQPEQSAGENKADDAENRPKRKRYHFKQVKTVFSIPG